VSTTGVHRYDPDTGDLDLLKSWFVGAIVGAVVDGGRLLVLSMLTDRVYLLDSETGQELATVRLSKGPRHAVRVNDAYVVSLYFGDELLVLSREDLQVLDSISVGPRPRNLYWSEPHQALYGLSLCGLFAIDGEAFPASTTPGTR